MKQQEFWKEVEKRTQENKMIVNGGMSPGLAPILEQVGMHFWIVGGIASLMMAIGIWAAKYDTLMRVVRVMIWR